MKLFENIDCMEGMKRYPDNHFDLAIVFIISVCYITLCLIKTDGDIMRQSNELQIGKAGEYLVCADLILAGYIAYPTEQGLPYDLILDAKKLYRIQVKTTREPRKVPQRSKDSFAYIFHVGRHGKNNSIQKYNVNEVDIFALVALDTRMIAYLPNGEMKSTMNFRVPALKGTYYDEQGLILKKKVLEYKEAGLSASEIAKKMDMSLSNVYKYQSVDITPKGNVRPVYFDEFTLERCINELG